MIARGSIQTLGREDCSARVLRNGDGTKTARRHRTGAVRVPGDGGASGPGGAQERAQAWNFSTQASRPSGLCAFFQLPAAYLFISASVG